MIKKMQVKTGDTVVVISGNYANGKEKTVGKVIGVSPDEGKVIVEGVHIVSKHVKPRKQGETGGRIEHEGTINASNVMLVCPKCGKATRVGHAMDGDKKVRVCKKCGKNID